MGPRLAQKWRFNTPMHRAYAQNLVCGATESKISGGGDKPPHQIAKLLISNRYGRCVFSGQSNQSLDFQGFGKDIQTLSTKLSAENLGNCHKFLQINDLPVFSPK